MRENPGDVEFIKAKETGKFWFVRHKRPTPGIAEFSFDKKTIFNFYSDFFKLTEEQQRIFGLELPGMTIDLLRRMDKPISPELRAAEREEDLEEERKERDRLKTKS